MLIANRPQVFGMYMKHNRYDPGIERFDEGFKLNITNSFGSIFLMLKPKLCKNFSNVFSKMYKVILGQSAKILLPYILSLHK